jgi:apolipoprotein N-acyltransferase
MLVKRMNTIALVLASAALAARFAGFSILAWILLILSLVALYRYYGQRHEADQKNKKAVE